MKNGQELSSLSWPASTVLVTLGTTFWGGLVLVMSCIQIYEKGFTLWLAEIMSKPIALLMLSQPIGSAAVMIFGRRTMLSYYVGSCTSLLWLLLVMILLYPRYPPRSLDDFFMFLGFYASVMSPFYILFHRFTFSLPSRLYYGMVREESPASEARSSET